MGVQEDQHSSFKELIDIFTSNSKNHVSIDDNITFPIPVSKQTLPPNQLIQNIARNNILSLISTNLSVFSPSNVFTEYISDEEKFNIEFNSIKDITNSEKEDWSNSNSNSNKKLNTIHDLKRSPSLIMILSHKHHTNPITNFTKKTKPRHSYINNNNINKPSLFSSSFLNNFKFKHQPRVINILSDKNYQNLLVTDNENNKNENSTIKNLSSNHEFLNTFKAALSIQKMYKKIQNYDNNSNNDTGYVLTTTSPIDFTAIVWRRKIKLIKKSIDGVRFLRETNTIAFPSSSLPHYVKVTKSLCNSIQWEELTFQEVFHRAFLFSHQFYRTISLTETELPLVDDSAPDGVVIGLSHQKASIYVLSTVRVCEKYIGYRQRKTYWDRTTIISKLIRKKMKHAQKFSDWYGDKETSIFNLASILYQNHKSFLFTGPVKKVSAIPVVCIAVPTVAIQSLILDICSNVAHPSFFQGIISTALFPESYF